MGVHEITILTYTLMDDKLNALKTVFCKSSSRPEKYTKPFQRNYMVKLQLLAQLTAYLNLSIAHTPYILTSAIDGIK